MKTPLLIQTCYTTFYKHNNTSTKSLLKCLNDYFGIITKYVRNGPHLYEPLRLTYEEQIIFQFV